MFSVVSGDEWVLLTWQPLTLRNKSENSQSLPVALFKLLHRGISGLKELLHCYVVVLSKMLWDGSIA